MRFLPTHVHGIIDYLAVIVLLALPRLLGWDDAVTTLLTLAASATLLYSLLTRYELGILPIIPMSGHLALDAASGLILLSAPWLGLATAGSQSSWLLGLGLFEIGAALVTKTTPRYLRQQGSATTTAHLDRNSSVWPGAQVSSSASMPEGGPSFVTRNQVVTDQAEREVERHGRLVANSEPINEPVTDREAREP